MFYADQQKICTKMKSIVFLAADFTPVIIWGLYFWEKEWSEGQRVWVYMWGVYMGEKEWGEGRTRVGVHVHIGNSWLSAGLMKLSRWH